ncbi:MAG TPA: DEAD/DEAH box helicase [Bacteroidales bacterium]|nr:DEAD/DEAH box helicase [Bacteroidales bacterium]HSA43026.1 DEAD/DEAH box helicase [Bacteroidales bacterium]
MTFSNLGLIAPLTDALSRLGYKAPTKIQQEAIPVLLQGKDIFGCARTGTGKTASFALPVLQLLEENKGYERKPVLKALVLAPTRELAQQISASFKDYGANLSLQHTTVFGGVSQHAQVQAIRRGVDILVATPGRLLDLVGQKVIRLDDIAFFILDEADRMLDMGFIHDIRKITGLLPENRQSAFFSATLTPEVMKLAGSMLNNPVSINVVPPANPAAAVQQSVYYVKRENKRSLLKHVLNDPDIAHALVFTRTKRGADVVVRELNRSGIRASAIHGNKSQPAREKALDEFKNRKIRVLVATDIASRGIDVDRISHVINFELPEVAETYIHRIGRTARAGNAGIALSFCSAEEKLYLRDISKLIRTNLDVVKVHPFI